jgi:nucleoside-diphosphate-sugar epimerase
MRIILTGSSGRLGRAIFNALAANNTVLGIDRSPFSTTHLVGDFTDAAICAPLYRELMRSSIARRCAHLMSA